MVLVFAAFWFGFGAKKTDIIPAAEGIKNKKIALSDTGQDSDGDGLKDWEEILWKTNPHEPDSDNDGTGDTDEIAQKRNPAKAGPDDLLPSPEYASALYSAKAPEEENTTSIIAKNLMRAYLGQKLASSKYNVNINEEKIAADVLRQIQIAMDEDMKKPLENHFTEEKLTIIAENKNTTKTYLNKIGEAIMSSQKGEEKGFYSQTIEAIKNNDFTGLESVKTQADVLKTIAENMQTIPVPQSLVLAHLGLINTFWRQSDIAEKISQFEKDPVGGIVALQKYQQETTRSLEPLARILDTIKNQNIEFEETEPGFIFAQYLPYRKENG